MYFRTYYNTECTLSKLIYQKHLKDGLPVYETLSLIAKKLRNTPIIWGVGGSILCHQYGLVEKPHDIDLLIDLDGAKHLEKSLGCLGDKQFSPPNLRYLTEYFVEFVINGVEVDVMGGLAMQHEVDEYRLVFVHYQSMQSELSWRSDSFHKS